MTHRMRRIVRLLGSKSTGATVDAAGNAPWKSSRTWMTTDGWVTAIRHAARTAEPREPHPPTAMAVLKSHGMKTHFLSRTSKSTHPYQRERASITGLRLKLRESMKTGRLIGVAVARLVRCLLVLGYGGLMCRCQTATLRYGIQKFRSGTATRFRPISGFKPRK